MVLPPLGYDGDAEETVAFYEAVAGGTELPIMAYNNPKASGTDMSPGLIGQLAELEGVAAIKECSGDARRIADLLNTVGDRIEVLVGGDDWALEGFCAGATGWVHWRGEHRHAGVRRAPQAVRRGPARRGPGGLRAAVAAGAAST